MTLTEHPARQVTDGFAIVALVLAMLSLIFGPLTSVPAIIVGHVASRRIRKNPALQGHGLALTGLIVGYAITLFTVIMVVLFTISVISGNAASAEYPGGLIR